MKKTGQIFYTYSWSWDDSLPAKVLQTLKDVAEKEIARQVLAGKTQGKLRHDIEIYHVLYTFEGEWHKA